MAISTQVQIKERKGSQERTNLQDLGERMSL